MKLQLSTPSPPPPSTLPNLTIWVYWENMRICDISQKLISWVFNDQPRRECAVVGLNGSFPAAGGGDLGKNVIAESDCLFPHSKIAHWSILLKGNGVFFGIAFPAAGLGPIVPMIGPIVSMIGP